MNNVSGKWKPERDDILGVFVGMLYVVAVYAYVGKVFIGLYATALILDILWVLLMIHGIFYRDTYNLVLSILNVVVAIISLVAIFFFSHNSIIVLSIFAILVALVLTNKTLYYLSRDQKVIN
jgi:hypothetical protein